MKKLISRRNVLRAASGAALALPLLPSMGVRRARAEAAEAPKRLVTMYTPNGVRHDGGWPTAVNSETDFERSYSHEPLKAYKDRLLVLGGLEMKVAADGPGGPHQRGIGGLFTNMQLGEGVFVDGCGRTAGWANGISVDQKVAGVIGAASPVASLQLGVRATENDVQGRISYAAAGMPTLLQMIESLWLQTGPTMRLLYPASFDTGWIGQRNHTAMLDAITAGDAEALVAAVRQDLLDGLARLERSLWHAAPEDTR